MMDRKHIETFQVQQLKSFLSVNTHVGCPINCRYCILIPMHLVPHKPVKTSVEEELVRIVESNKYFVPNTTILSINNRTDPFLNKETTNSTLLFIELFDSKGYQNPIIITSKTKLSQDATERLGNVKNVKVFIFVTYSNLPYEIEPLKGSPQLKTLSNLSQLSNPNVKSIHYWGPLISDYNTSEKILAQTLESVQNLATCSIAVGLKSDSTVISNFTNNKLKHPNKEVSDIKVISENLMSKIRDIRDQIAPGYTIFRHTSCAVSWIMRWSDYNAYWTNPNNCMFSCPNQKVCDSYERPSEEEVTGWLNKLSLNVSFAIHDNKVMIDNELTLEDVAFLRNQLRFKVEATSIIDDPYIEWIDKEK